MSFYKSRLVNGYSQAGVVAEGNTAIGINREGMARARGQKLYTALRRMKDYEPELFHTTVEEQIAKITVQLAGSFLRWLVSE